MLSGKIYFTNSTKSCCGGKDDGDIKFQYTNDRKLKNVLISQDLEFSGKACPGTYKGSGAYSNNIISIKFTGTDCEGAHSDGEIELVKEN